MEEVNGKVNGHAEPSQAIVAAPPAALVAGNDETVEQKLARAEKQIAFKKGILRLIAANLEPTDITLYGEGDRETVHLTKHACKQILGWAGITVQPDNNILDRRYEGVEGPYIDFEVWGTWFTPDGRYYRTMGNRSTYDDFFAKRTKWTCECGSDVRWDNRTAICVAQGHRGKAEKTTYYLPLSEVDIPSVKQAAITNFWNHIVEDAGLKPSKKELLAVGFNFGEVKDRVTFGSNSNKPADTKPQTTSQKPQDTSPKGASATTPNAPKPDAPASSGPAKAKIPNDPIPGGPPKATVNTQLPIGQGIVGEVVEKKTKPKNGKGGGTPFLEVTQNGYTLYAFKNSELETMEGPERAFEIIKAAKGQFCHFVIETNGSYQNIVGAYRIGPHAWDAQTGEPVRASDGYVATDEDIPF